MPFTNEGALVLPNSEIDFGNGEKVGHHVTMTGDIGAGIMKCHDTFQSGPLSTNVSGEHYNNLNGPGNEFNPSPATADTFGKLF